MPFRSWLLFVALLVVVLFGAGEAEGRMESDEYDALVAKIERRRGVLASEWAKEQGEDVFREATKAAVDAVAAQLIPAPRPVRIFGRDFRPAIRGAQRVAGS
jgi:hypothetical protein